MYSSPSYESSEATDSEDMDTSSDALSSEESDSQEDACGSPDLEIESPTSESSSSSSAASGMTNKFCSILPFNVNLPGPSSRFPLPSLRDLGIFNSSASRANAEGMTNESSARLAPPSQPSSAREVAEQSAERGPEPYMASLPPPLSNSMPLLPMIPSGPGSMAHNFYNMNAGHAMLPPDSNPAIFFGSDNYSQFIPSFPQNQLGAMDYVNDMHEFGMNGLPLPGGLGGSEIMGGSPLGYDNTNPSVIEDVNDAQHERSRASSPMEISSGRPSPDPEDAASSPPLADEDEDEDEGETFSNCNQEEEVDDDVPRSTLFLPPKQFDSTNSRLSSPEVTEISREKYLAEFQSKKEKSVGIALPAEPRQVDRLEEQREELHRHIMHGSLSQNTASIFARRIAFLRESLQSRRERSSTRSSSNSPNQRPIIPLPVSRSHEEGRSVNARSEISSTDEPSVGPPSIRSESVSTDSMMLTRNSHRIIFY